jgi:hypothetical protein
MLIGAKAFKMTCLGRRARKRERRLLTGALREPLEDLT